VEGSTFTGSITVDGGSLRLAGTAGQAHVRGGRLLLSGSTVAGITVQGGAALEIQGSSTAGDLTFVTGGAPARFHGSSLTVARSVALSIAQFNGGLNPVIGTFLGLPEGSVINSGGASYRLSYFGGSGNDVTLTELVAAAAETSTTLTSSMNPSLPGQRVTFTASVSGGARTGNVNFYDGGILIGSTPLDGTGRASFTGVLPAGSHYITAGYSSAATFAASQATLRQDVVRSRTRPARSSSR